VLLLLLLLLWTIPSWMVASRAFCRLLLLFYCHGINYFEDCRVGVRVRVFPVWKTSNKEWKNWELFAFFWYSSFSKIREYTTCSCWTLLIACKSMLIKLQAIPILVFFLFMECLLRELGWCYVLLVVTSSVLAVLYFSSLFLTFTPQRSRSNCKYFWLHRKQFEGILIITPASRNSYCQG